jgi:hypothetical protein
VVIAVLALPMACMSLVFPGPYTTAFPRTFNSEQWKAADTWGDARCGMIADLNYRIGIVGKTRTDLVAMLGAPEDEDNDPTLSHWHLCPSFMDVFILEVRWRGDRVEDAWVRDT